MKYIIDCFLVWFGMNILFAAWLTLRAWLYVRKQRRIAMMAFYCAKGELPRGLRDKLMRGIIKRI